SGKQLRSSTPSSSRIRATASLPCIEAAYGTPESGGLVATNARSYDRVAEARPGSRERGAPMSDSRKTGEQERGQLTRRRFLQGAAAAGAVLGAAGVSGLPDAWAGMDAVMATPKRGGRLRVGMVGGGQAETLDPNLAVSTIDTCRVLTLYDLLVRSK